MDGVRFEQLYTVIDGCLTWICLQMRLEAVATSNLMLRLSPSAIRVQLLHMLTGSNRSLQQIFTNRKCLGIFSTVLHGIALHVPPCNHNVELHVG